MAHELLQKAAQSVEAARAIEVAAGGTAKLTAEQRTAIDQHLLEARNYRANVKTELDLKSEEKAIAEIRSTPVNQAIRPVAAPSAARNLRAWDTEAYEKEFRSFIRTNRFNENAVENEIRAMQQGLDSTGGFLVVPTVMMPAFLKNADDPFILSGLVTSVPMPKSASLGVIEMGDDASDPDWTSEIAEAQEGTDLTFKKRELKPHPLSKLYKLSRKLIGNSSMDVEAFLLARLGRKFGLAKEKASMTGSGVAQPLGVFTPHAEGIPTSRDISTGNTTTSPTFDGWINLKYSLKPVYRPNAKLITSTEAVLKSALLKDLEGRYIWQPSVTVGVEERISNMPVLESAFCPNTLTASQYIGVYGDFSYYWMAVVELLQIQVLYEMYAKTNQNGYIARGEFDGQPVLAEAFSRAQLAAS